MKAKLQALLAKLPRTTIPVVLTALLIAIISSIAHQQLTVIVYKVTLISTAAIISYWTDRWLYRDVGSMAETPKEQQNHRMIARALIFAGAAVALMLGV
jgi:uncharacterized membrane protein